MLRPWLKDKQNRMWLGTCLGFRLMHHCTGDPLWDSVTASKASSALIGVTKGHLWVIVGHITMAL